MNDTAIATAPERIDFARGDATGLAIPAHPEALHAAGPEFLTQAFRAWGSLAADNRVTRIVSSAPVLEGNSGEKLLLSLEYERDEPGLPHDFFVKFSRYFPEAFRDRRRYELAPEIRLAELSRLPAFPVTVARPLFADFEEASGTGLLISERIHYGRDGIEPFRPKNLDYELANPREYYQATLGSLARLAAAHKSGRLSPLLEQLFPYDREAAMAEIPIPWDEAQIRAKMAGLRDLVGHAPRLFPASVRDPAFLARIEDEAARFLHHEADIRRFLHADPDYVALSHWNTHLDNGWFWRDHAGVLQCGLLDWGMVRQMNFGVALWGGLSAATQDFWDGNLEALLVHFTRELQAHGGPTLDPARLALHFEMAATMLCLALFADAPHVVLSRMPDLAEMRDTRDPLLRRNLVAHGFLNGTTNFLTLWATRDFGASLDRVLESMDAVR